MSNAIDSRIISQLETRFIALEEEYSEELDDHEKHGEGRRNREARKELSEKLEELEEILEDRNEWIYLVSSNNTQLISSKNSPDYIDLKIHFGHEFGKAQYENTEIIYSVFELPDENFIVMTADLSEKNEYMILYRNRFLIVSFIITIIGILMCFAIIRSSLKGFAKVRLIADSIAAGDYSKRVNSQDGAPTEVVELSSSFNNMIERTQSLLKEIKEVSNNVAHDLRTPLTRIRGKVETTLMADASLLEHKELSGLVIEECDKLMLLINNMLTLAEYESGLATKKNERIDLKKLLQKLCEVFETVMEDKGIISSIDLSKEDLFIFGDTEKIQRSLSNLLDNAIKYTSENGEIKIVANVENETIKIVVEDTGCGINEDDQKRIFERFYRVEDSRTTPGNGLGLNLAKAFIENHGGKISVDSKLGKGSAFKILFSPTT